ncbi:MAG: hypothetical protein CMM59_05235 [Rhodospirillaceae bacterium]|nr:hypothetical protein [Rhodospirillaceae bacterium]|tara:strand:- start:601 stop:807 length:207 start_codon:yes stop_codon:yes gene_type:complete
MSYRNFVVPVLFGLLLLSSVPHGNASQGIQLNDQIKAALSAAKPVRGNAPEREMFDGKPLLVVFFASW